MNEEQQTHCEPISGSLHHNRQWLYQDLDGDEAILEIHQTQGRKLKVWYYSRLVGPGELAPVPLILVNLTVELILKLATIGSMRLLRQGPVGRLIEAPLEYPEGYQPRLLKHIDLPIVSGGLWMHDPEGDPVFFRVRESFSISATSPVEPLTKDFFLPNGTEQSPDSGDARLPEHLEGVGPRTIGEWIDDEQVVYLIDRPWTPSAHRPKVPAPTLF